MVEEEALLPTDCVEVWLPHEPLARFVGVVISPAGSVPGSEGAVDDSLR